MWNKQIDFAMSFVFENYILSKKRESRTKGKKWDFSPEINNVDTMMYVSIHAFTCVCVCVCACVRACVRACMHACMRIYFFNVKSWDTDQLIQTCRCAETKGKFRASLADGRLATSLSTSLRTNRHQEIPSRTAKP